MRILIVSINYAPELTGVGKYTGEMAEWLGTNGHDVRVVTAPPYYPEWHVAKGYASWAYRMEDAGGVRIWRCPLWVPSKPSGLKRILHLASFAISSFPVMLRQLLWRPDLVIAIEPPLFCAPSAWLCARLSGGKAWLHIQDFEVDAAFELGILRARWLRRVVAYLESMLMRRFDRVSTISHNMKQRLTRKKVSTEKTVLFSNWVDVAAIFPQPEPSAMRKELSIPDNVAVALYSGNMGEKQGLEIVLEAAAQLEGEEAIHFVMCGEGAARDRLQKKYAGLKNVRWLPLQPLERLNDLLNMANIHLLPQKSGAEDLVMPSKLTGMLASGRPVVATANIGSQIEQVVRSCGIVVEPDNIEQFRDAVLRLAKDEALAASLGKQGRAYALNHLDRNTIMQEFDERIRGL